MKIDWDKKADPEAVRETSSMLRGGAVPERPPRRVGLERFEHAPGGGTEGATARRSERERVERLDEAISTAEINAPEGEQEEIRKEVVAGARSALAKTFEGEAPERFTLREQVGLEAVILTNGERPSLFVKNGFVDLAAPDVGDWEWALGRFEKDIRSVTGSVGRIDVPVNPGFAGTCFVLEEGLVVTNRHVLEEIATADGDGWALNWPDSTTVDFNGEDGATGAVRFTVTGVAFAGPDVINGEINFARLDMAVLRVDPAGDVAFPTPVTFATDAAQPKAKRNLYVLGFPGKPRKWLFDGVPPARHETAEVLSAIFNNRFGVKKLAPGVVKTGPGGLSGDAKAWVYSHDASTLGGNSGSAVFDLTDGGLEVVGLHFGGENRGRNWAHAASKLKDQFAGATGGGSA